MRSCLLNRRLLIEARFNYLSTFLLKVRVRCIIMLSSMDFT